VKDLKEMMDRFRKEIVEFASELIPHSMDRLKSIATEPGTYVFFRGRMDPFKVGSSIQPVTRLREQRQSIRESIARSIAEDLGVFKRDNPEKFEEILKGIGDIPFGFVPQSKVDEFDMGLRQFEGLLMWALQPRGNGWVQESDRLGISGCRRLGMGF
jgi:hypothetical protein